MTTITTATTSFGTLDANQLKELKGAVEEINIHQEKNRMNNEAIKSILDAASENLNIPKKIIKKMANAQFKKNFGAQVSEQKEFEELFQTTFNVRV